MGPGEESDFSFLGLDANDIFQFQGIPNSLDEDQTLDPSALSTFPKSISNSRNAFLDEQENSAAFALQDTYLEESLSDSSSSKRTSSGSSSKGRAVEADVHQDVMMEDGAPHNTVSPDQIMETPNLQSPSFDTPPFDGDSHFDPDEFMNQSFYFERASSSPIEKPKPQPTPSRRPTQPAKSHLKSRSVRVPRYLPNVARFPNSSQQISFQGPSREVSPHSTSFITSNASSPNAPMDFHTPMDFSDPTQILMQAQGWPQQFANAANPMSHAFAHSPMMLARYSNLMPIPHGINATAPFLSFDTEGLPPRTRVETQIHLKTLFGQLPPGIAKLRLPKHTISKAKLWSKEPYACSPDTLDLHTMLVCTSAMENEESRKRAFKRALEGPNSGFGDPRPEEDTDADKPSKGGEVWICNNCIDRERKRSERKKVKKPEEEAIWKGEEWRRVVVFNTHEVKEFPKPDPLTGRTVVELPMRIACYCRHQQEKSGFQVIFTVRDHMGRVLAQELTPSIMITDDHKNHVAPPSINSAAKSSAATKPASTPPKPNAVVQPTAFRPAEPVSDMGRLQAGPQPAHRRLPTAEAVRPFSRPASPNSLAGAPAKKRKSSAGKLPVSMAMTPLDTAATVSPPRQLPEMHSATPSPFAPGPMPFNPQDSFFTGNSPTARTNLLGTSPSTPGMDDPSLFSPAAANANAEALARQRFSASHSAHASRAASPSGLNNPISAAALQAQFSHLLPASAGLAGLNPLEDNLSQARGQQYPTITRIIPEKGSKMGGYEVTVLGEGFHRALEVMFGDKKASGTWFWGPNLLVCVVPASPVSGEVTVTFPKHQSGVQCLINPEKFTYVDDEEDKLLRSAMEVLARKMNGNLGDVKNFAMSILNHRGLPPHQSGGRGGTSSGQGYGNSASSSAPALDLEMQVMKCLKLIDMDDSPHKAQWNYQDSSGHTMLHLACARGYHRLAAVLLARGANVDVPDNSGFTPLHIAAMNGHPEIVQRLHLAGADPTAPSRVGLTPVDVARSGEVIDVLRRATARRTRSRSLGSLRSAPGSSTSLNSLWGPVAPMTSYEGASDDVDIEYSSLESSDSDEEVQERESVAGGLNMRRPSVHASGTHGHAVAPVGEDSGDVEAPPSPNAAAAAFRQFQQSMGLYMQNLPQMPQMPQMPALMGAQADQAPLYYAQLMRRLTALMPGRGQRPGTPEAERAMGIRGWWDRSSGVNDAVPPPSYEDLYPDREMDSKAKSAEEALAMQGRDVKSAADAALEEEAEVEAAEDDEEVAGARVDGLGVLKIGRKNAITKEQQRDILRAHEAKLKRLSSDKNLFMIWVCTVPPGGNFPLTLRLDVRLTAGDRFRCSWWSCARCCIIASPASSRTSVR